MACPAQAPDWAPGSARPEERDDDADGVGAFQHRQRGVKALGKFKVSSRHHHGGGDGAGAGVGDGDQPAAASASESSSESDSDSDASDALSEDLVVVNAVEEAPEDEEEVAARRARIRDRLRARASGADEPAADGPGGSSGGNGTCCHSYACRGGGWARDGVGRGCHGGGVRVFVVV